MRLSGLSSPVLAATRSQGAHRVRWTHHSRVGAVLGAILALALFASPASALPRLGTERGDEARIIDSRGREVLLRGVNVNQLGDYFQEDPALEPAFPLRRRDFARIDRLGFNVIRLVVSWSALEPEPGAFDRRYVRRIRRAVRRARRRGIYVVLDMHQDAWGKYVATPEGESCPPGLGPAVGWDGAPDWATITDGATTCRAADTRELSFAVSRAFDNFYADRAGIQGRLVATWARLAEEFAANPAIAGYDLINEPHPGTTPGPTQTALLGEYYSRAVEAIRAAEARRQGGFPHIVFFEPSVIWSGFSGDGLPTGRFTADENIVFAPHLYSESITVPQRLGIEAVSIEEGFDLAEQAADSYGVPLWSGEWGFFAEDPASDIDRYSRYAAAEDEHLVGGAVWVWRETCGDPHNFSAPGAEPYPWVGNVNRYACPENRARRLVRARIRVLSRSYPRAAPGWLTELRSDPASGRFELSGYDPRRAGGCGLRVWVPGARGTRRLRVRGKSVRRIAARRLPGGWLVRGCAHGAYELRGGPVRRGPEGR